MKKDFFVYSNFDQMIFSQGLSEAEAQAFRAELIAQYPDDAQYINVSSISADPILAATIAFAHIANF